MLLRAPPLLVGGAPFPPSWVTVCGGGRYPGCPSLTRPSCSWKSSPIASIQSCQRCLCWLSAFSCFWLRHCQPPPLTALGWRARQPTSLVRYMPLRLIASLLRIVTCGCKHIPAFFLKNPCDPATKSEQLTTYAGARIWPRFLTGCKFWLLLLRSISQLRSMTWLTTRSVDFQGGQAC